ncbi:MAG: nucleotide sugar dehydrogenase [Calditerrivibrio sp.]|nr:nucleotide sugar dehydrogenase [Calditerrivibrio sp.]
MYNLKSFEKNGDDCIAIIGLGYVGLPLAEVFDRRYNVIGFDINENRIEELKRGYDRTKEVSCDVLKRCGIMFTNNPKDIAKAKVIIVTVPTPVDEYNIPDLKPILSASKTVGRYMKKGTIVVYESTVYPGLTEEECVPVLERESGLRWKQDFNVGYSPERVNPGDKLHTIDKIKKVVAGDTNETLEFLADLYGGVITAGIHKSPSIKVAEAAKVIENTQRDINIALMNELALIFDRVGISTKDVLDAAATKWNFLRFEPGLVGGHCIGVDPYYLTFKAKALGYHPEVILSGRRINDNMGKFVAEKTVKKLIKAGKAVKDSKVLILGLTFKENISDIRNTKVVDIVRELQEYGVNTFIYDPKAYHDEVKHEYGLDMLNDIHEYKPYDAVVLAVKHKEFIDMGLDNILSLMNMPVLIDVKGIFADNKKGGVLYWCL